jgi:hypothetical protein
MGPKELGMFQRTAVSAVVVFFCAIGSSSSGGELVLAENGQSAYQIVVADSASPSTKHGAEELQTFLEQISGAKLPIVSDQQPQGPKEIILGDNTHLQKLGVNVDLASLGNEGYVIRTVGDHLVIAGGALRGTMYGVYGLLEDHLGCRWFAPGVSRIPKQTKLVVGSIDERQVPTLEYREPFTFECFDGDWCARNRMNSSAGRLDATRGGKMGISSLCHTWMWLMPTDKYFAEHPEYYAMVDGKRLKDNPQLCCTNPDVRRICTEAVLKLMREQPQNTVFSVSQNDWDNHCECPACQEVATREESQMGPVMELVNYVAERVEKEFPDKIVETLAYQWTRKPPKTIRPRPNVIIMLCSIECCFSHSLEQCDSAMNRTFRADIEGWSKVAPRLWVWDYVTNFGNYLLPFPNQRVRAPNIRFFVAHNVKGIFEQDTYDTPDSELWALGGYMTAKLLWNQNYDANLAMSEFLEGYYGKAAVAVRGYIDLMHDYAEQKNIHVTLWSPAGSAHLDDGLLVKADSFWQQAEDAAAAEPEVLERVKRSRMSVDYAIVERARLEAKNQLPANEALAQLAAARFEPFCEVLGRSPMNRLKEYELVDKEAYRRDLAKDLRISIDK